MAENTGYGPLRHPEDLGKEEEGLGLSICLTKYKCYKYPTTGECLGKPRHVSSWNVMRLYNTWKNCQVKKGRNVEGKLLAQIGGRVPQRMPLFGPDQEAFGGCEM